MVCGKGASWSDEWGRVLGGWLVVVRIANHGSVCGGCHEAARILGAMSGWIVGGQGWHTLRNGEGV